jgi:hypothetical protein
MATTATKLLELPVGPVKIQVWDVSAGGADTTATFDTGLNNVQLLLSNSQDDSSHGTVKNSNNGTLNSAFGHVYFSGVINSAKLYVLVIGS